MHCSSNSRPALRIKASAVSETFVMVHSCDIVQTLQESGFGSTLAPNPLRHPGPQSTFLRLLDLCHFRFQQGCGAAMAFSALDVADFRHQAEDQPCSKSLGCIQDQVTMLPGAPFKQLIGSS